MDEAGRHHPLRRGKEAVTTPWRSVQDAEKANGTVAWQALPCRFDPLRLVQSQGLYTRPIMAVGADIVRNACVFQNAAPVRLTPEVMARNPMQ